MPAHALTWDIFCRVIDNHGDLGVCWRLARNLAARGHQARLWVDDASALRWMAPEALAGGVAGVRVLPWPTPFDACWLARQPRADVWVEAFGCELPSEFVAHGVRATAPGKRAAPVWVNLEYLSAEDWTARMHRLPSPVLHGPATGWTKWFFYPGFTPETGGLLREPDLVARQDAFDRGAWLAGQGIGWQGERLVSLFCYEPPALADLLVRLRAGPQPTLLLVTAGRAAQALQAGGATEGGALTIRWLPYLTQHVYDELLWACDLNFVRGEDSLVRALWAGRPFVWQPYPQHDGAHHAKLAAFLRWLQAPESLRTFHRAWSGIDVGPLPALDLAAWGACASAARCRLLGQADLATQLAGFVQEKR